MTAQAARDPIYALKQLGDADRQLDGIAAATKSAQEQEQRDRAALDTELSTATSVVSGVSDYISTRRGAMNTTARTRLAEARRHLDRGAAAGRRPTRTARSGRRGRRPTWHARRTRRRRTT
jgi:hypothetical protein